MGKEKESLSETLQLLDMQDKCITLHEEKEKEKHKLMTAIENKNKVLLHVLEMLHHNQYKEDIIDYILQYVSETLEE